MVPVDLSIDAPAAGGRCRAGVSTSGEFMFSRMRWRRFGLVSGAGGLVLINSCLASLERNVDILFAPQALENTIAAPYSAVAGLVEFLARLAWG
jgi:hypothetical protein